MRIMQRRVRVLTKYDTSTSKFFTQDIANELAEMNRLKRLELKMKYQIPEWDLNDWGVVDKA
jgi:hypothetical protein